MKKWLNIFSVSLLAGIILSACNKQTLENYNPDIYQNYLSLQKGQVRIYRLDSTVATNFGVSLVVHSYLLKDSVGSQNIDGSGDTTYNIYRFITDTLQTQPWQFSILYRMVVKKNTAELIDENNLRFIKLANPVSTDYSWDGNRYFLSGDNGISSDSPLYMYLNWSYQYENIDAVFSNAYGQFNNTITVNEVDKTIGNEGDFDPTLFQERTLSKVVYAKGVGMVYRKFLYYTYQPNPNNNGASGSYEQDSYGIEMTLLQ